LHGYAPSLAIETLDDWAPDLRQELVSVRQLCLADMCLRVFNRTLNHLRSAWHN